MTPKTKSFITPEKWQGKVLFSDWEAAEGGKIDVANPANGQTIASVGFGISTDITRAAKEASVAQRAWAKEQPETRKAILDKAADLLEANAEELIPWIMQDSGSTRIKAGIEIEHGAAFIRHAASLATQPMTIPLPDMEGRPNYARRVPHGVVGVISPFNFPLVLSVRAIAPALALGNAVVHKPDPRTPISGGIIIARIFEEAGLPQGLLHIIPGGASAGEALCTTPDIAMVSFTGSANAGSRVGELCGKHLKKVQLELGGKNTLIILDDADIAVAASNAAWGAFLHQGQICIATGLVLAHDSIADEIAKTLATRAQKLPVGDPLSDQVALGPIISDNQIKTIQDIVNDAVKKGARLLTGGTPTDRFYPATVLAGVTPDMQAFHKEIFGPVACIASFASDEQAVELANMSEYGLAAGVISGSRDRALEIGEQLNVGHLHINDQTVNAGPFAPFGGRGKSGNGTRIGGPADIAEFTQWLWVSVQDEATAYPF
ncbi:benzaldehyde dehydrogenase [Thalassospira profundimaris]|uniref:Benzaldehyde dehydrogenase n=1 Tax=Thalassospira profundimaris TaxID=502049 RepID=A0A367X196_9PROT|nr:benzaldehyde dehydrogenase [Thalassospira profundimaris]RCK46521.1 benzaldehyde dehydrogenase [Thalassospira profundimaris]